MLSFLLVLKSLHHAPVCNGGKVNVSENLVKEWVPVCVRLVHTLRARLVFPLDKKVIFQILFKKTKGVFIDFRNAVSHILFLNFFVTTRK